MTQLILAVIYLAFISLGLPDSLLGSAWPSMYVEFGVPLSYAGIISMIIAFGTIISSLMSDRLTKKFGTGMVTAISVALTATALIGFSISHSFMLLCLWAVPYGLGAGSVDASLNNYVALHYESRHMSWLHCMWGVGATIGPYIMGFALTNGHNWNGGYRYIGIIQIVLTAVIVLSLPLWKKQPIQPALQARKSDSAIQPEQAAKLDSAIQQEQAVKLESAIQQEQAGKSDKALTIREIIRIPGAKEVMIFFFCYCALEQATGLWASSYLNLSKGIDVETAAGYASLFYIGITIGRAISGFITMKLNDTKMIRLGLSIIFAGLLIMTLPLPKSFALAGLIVVGLGCAPVYPCIIHSTPVHFGTDRSQALIGVQMASAYIGTCLMPPLFGIISSALTVAILPLFLLLFLVMMVITHELLNRKA